MLRVILASLIISAAASAHVDPGTYTGVDENGQACGFTVGADWFEDNMAHPLNERIPLSLIHFTGHAITNVIWNAGHPPVLNVQKGQVRFNHDTFVQIVATKTGAASVVLLKNNDETSTSHKPLGLIYIEDDYKDAKLSKNLKCTL